MKISDGHSSQNRRESGSWGQKVASRQLHLLRRLSTSPTLENSQELASHPFRNVTPPDSPISTPPSSPLPSQHKSSSSESQIGTLHPDSPSSDESHAEALNNKSATSDDDKHAQPLVLDGVNVQQIKQNLQQHGEIPEKRRQRPMSLHLDGSLDVEELDMQSNNQLSRSTQSLDRFELPGNTKELVNRFSQLTTTNVSESTTKESDDTEMSFGCTSSQINLINAANLAQEKRGIISNIPMPPRGFRLRTKSEPSSHIASQRSPSTAAVSCLIVGMP